MMLKIILLSSLILLPTKGVEIEDVKPVPKDVIIFDMETIKIAEAIKKHETNGNCSLKGASGEIGCMQYTKGTWNALTKKYYGEVKGYSTTTEEFITLKYIQDLGDLKPQQVFQTWNQGTYKKPCIRGVNKFGVKYDSCAYIKKVMAIYNKL